MVKHFTWNAKKEARNIQKHGVDFTEAAEVFQDVLSQRAETFENGEERIVLVGMSLAGLLLVVYVEVTETSARIISARKVTNHERKNYEEGI